MRIYNLRIIVPHAVKIFIFHDWSAWRFRLRVYWSHSQSVFRHYLHALNKVTAANIWWPCTLPGHENLVPVPCIIPSCYVIVDDPLPAPYYITVEPLCNGHHWDQRFRGVATNHHWDQRFRGVATNQGFYKYYFNAVRTKVSGHYREVATCQGWPLRGFHCST